MSEVPREFTGLARAFHRQVRESDRQYIAMRDQIWDALRTRLNCRPILRLPECHDLFRAWQGCPAFGRIQNHTSMRYSKRRVEFHDARLMGALRHFDDGGTEQAVGVTVTRLIADTRFSVQAGERSALLGQPLVHVAVFGLHSIARYFQKSFQQSEPALIAAMWHVFWSAGQVIQPGVHKFSIPLHGGGHWYGTLQHAQGQSEHGEPGKLDDPYVAIDVRTFHSDKDHREISLEAAPPESS